MTNLFIFSYFQLLGEFVPKSLLGVGASLYSVADLLSGVVLGSGISPVTCIIFIDGLAKLMEAHSIQCKIFADDVKIYITVLNVNCTSKLQAALNLISAWADDCMATAHIY